MLKALRSIVLNSVLPERGYEASQNDHISASRAAPPILRA